MFTVAGWIVRKEWQAVDWIAAEDADPLDVIAMKGVVALSTSPIWIGVGVSPYWTMHQQAARMSWAVDDIRHTRKMKAKYGSLGAKFRTLTYWNYFPKHRTFAMRGGWRWAATKVGSRFIPYVGWALLAYDLYSVGKWVHGKTRWGNPTPGPTP